MIQIELKCNSLFKDEFANADIITLVHSIDLSKIERIGINYHANVWQYLHLQMTV